MAPVEPPPEYTVYRTRPRLFGRRREAAPERTPGHGPPPARGPLARRVLAIVLAVVAAWLTLALVLFLVSAQIQRGKVSDAARASLSPSGYTLTSANTILVLGSDARTKGTKEAGANVGGPSRSDSILLLRTGGGAGARLSVPRDAVVDIPGHGRQKINAAYALGGAALAVRTVERYLGLEVNHLVEVDFARFPRLIDAVGGIDYRSDVPVLSKINGGRENGGTTLRLRRGENHLSGQQALALARTRKNLRRPNEDDLTRARRQQKIMDALRHRLVSPAALLRAPRVAWAGPQTVRSDMGGPSLLGVFGAVTTSGTGAVRVLRPSGYVTLADGEVGLEVPESERQAAVKRFLAG